MLHTKEFQEVMNSFEKIAKQFVSTGSMGFTREPRENWEKQRYYSDGEVNKAFKLYLLGYSYGKCCFITENN